MISPAITTSPVQVSVSHATRLNGSCARQASRIASEIWSAILSGWPSVTDSLVNKKRSRFAKTTPPSHRVQIFCNPAILPSHPGCGKTSTSSGENRHPNREILHWLAIGWHLRQSGSRTNRGPDQIAALPAPLK